MLNCAFLFDREEIKCGVKDGMNIKVFAACLHTERARDNVYMNSKGARFLFLDRKIGFAQHRELCRFEGAEVLQTTLGVDFTRFESCVEKYNDDHKCVHKYSWGDYVGQFLSRDPGKQEGKPTKEYLI